METNYQCAGVCTHASAYVYTDVHDKAPTTVCGQVMIQSIDKLVTQLLRVSGMLLLAAIISFISFSGLLFYYPLYKQGGNKWSFSNRSRDDSS